MEDGARQLQRTMDNREKELLYKREKEHLQRLMRRLTSNKLSKMLHLWSRARPGLCLHNVLHTWKVVFH